MELWDAYDENFNRIDGVTLVRGEVIPDRMYHLVCDIAVKHIDGTYLVMQRAFCKHFGGMWELTAGGSALKGESPKQCAARELTEETGIASNDLQKLGVVVNRDNQSIYCEYLCVTDCDKDSVALQDGETIDFKWLTVREIKNLSSTEFVTIRMKQFIKEI